MEIPTLRLTSIKGINLELLDTGSGDPVVFVHGGMGDECFSVIQEPALQEKFRIIHFHLRGWGKSELGNAPYSVELLTSDTRNVMEHLGVERAHLVGQSSGGNIVLQFALDYPDATQSIAVLEPFIPEAIGGSQELGTAMKEAMERYQSGDKAGALNALYNVLLGSDFHSRFNQTMPSGWFERWVDDSDTLFYGAPAMASWNFTRDHASRIGQPVLNVTGENTFKPMRQCYELIKGWMPHAENVVLENANHTMFQTNPTGAANVLADFFSRHPINK